MSPSATQAETRLDDIAQVSAPLHETSSLSPLVQLLTLAFQVKIPPKSKQERLLTLLNTLSPSSPASSGSDPQVRIGSYIRFLSPVLNGFAGMGDFEAAVGAFSKPGEFREFWDLDGKNLITEFVSDVGSQRILAGSDVAFLDEFVKDTSLKVGLTDKLGMLVLVPAETEVGDGVWDIGVAERVMVRRGEADGAKEIGSAYIDHSLLS